jgi:hypothetical protein
VVVRRIAEADVTSTQPVPYDTQTQTDNTLYVGDRTVLQEGINGQRTVVEHVVTVDGVETSRTPVSDEVTTQPVAEVIATGTKKKPVAPAAPATPPAPAVPKTRPVDPDTTRAIGADLAAQRGWTGDEWACLDALFSRESGWNPLDVNRSSGAYGIPQAVPGSKMASAGADWETNPATQITWGLGYIAGRYGTPCGAWAHSEASGWY